MPSTVANYSSVAGQMRLVSPITNASTSIQVDSITGLPATPFKLILDYGGISEEIVKVTGMAGSTLTVVRGYDGSTAVSHAAQAPIRHGITAEDLTLSRAHEESTTAHGVSGAVVGTTGAQTLTSKTISLGSNTVSGTRAQFNAAMTDDDFASLTGTETLTNKTVNLASNTLTGTRAQFNAAITDDDFASLAGAETLTNKTINLASNTLTGTKAQFNVACSDADFATLTGAETLTNKTLTTPILSDGKYVKDCTSTTRPGSPATGQLIYESDTQTLRYWDGATWRYLGYDTGWVTISTFTGGWLNLDTSVYQAAAYRRINSRVFVRGIIKSGTGAAFTIPAPHRPLKNEIFSCIAGAGVARVDVDTAGNVNVASYAASGDNSFVSLSGVFFDVE